MTAETAVVLPVLFVVLAVALFVLSCVSAQLRCTDAAALAARAAARGDPAQEVSAAGSAVGPPGADVHVSQQAGNVEVRVTASVRPMAGLLSALPAVQVSGRAVAAREDLVGQP